jgi:hypothetical protein
MLFEIFEQFFQPAVRGYAYVDLTVRRFGFRRYFMT